MIRSVESVVNEDSSGPDALPAWVGDPDFAEVPWGWLRKRGLGGGPLRDLAFSRRHFDHGGQGPC
eukprot:2523614-Pyramimonas_sp.AAC.1